MNNVTLGAERREGTGKGVARKLRQAGKLPAVVYGRDMDPIHISIDAHKAELLFRSIPVDNTVVELTIEGDSTPHQTLIREIQTHPYRAYLVHVDFLRIQAGVKVDMNVPLHLIGDPVGVRDHGGVLEQTIHDIPITCIPSAIPESIDVDVSALDLNDTLHISDLVVAEGVEIQLPPERTICSVSVPRAAIEEKDADEDEAGEPEVIGEEGGDEEGEE